MGIKAFFTRLGVESAIEEFWPVLTQGLTEWLIPWRADMVPEVVKSGRFPDIDTSGFGAVAPYIGGLSLIPLGAMTVRMGEAIKEVRPDLWQALEDCGDEGMFYVAKLTAHLLDLVKHPEKGVMYTGHAPRRDTVMVRCESCKKEWPVSKAEVANIKECVFCHTPV